MAYIGKSPSGTGVRSRFYYTQTTGGATSVSSTDDNNKTLTFTDGEYIDVYLNGVLLVAGTDYNTNTANTISGLAALASGDVVEVLVYDIFTVADTVSATQGGTFNSAVEFTSGFTASDGCTITTADNDPQLTLTSTDADSNFGPKVVMYRNSSSPADDDFLGLVEFQGENSAGETTTYGQFFGRAHDVTDGTEDGRVAIKTMINGTTQNVLDIIPNEFVINQDGVNMNFRVESDSKTNAFFVQGGGGTDGFIGLNESSPQKMLHITKNDSDGIIILDADGTETDHQICFAKDYGTGSTTGGKYFGFGVDGSEEQLVIAYDNNSQASLSADGKFSVDKNGTATFFTQSGTGAAVITTDVGAGTTYNLFQARHSATGINSNGTQCFFVTTNGNAYNTNGTFGTGSDQKLKENIVDANSQWDDIKALQVRNFNKIGNTDVHIGVVAQELEASGMSGLVDEHADLDADGNDLGTVTKSVKYSILYMKAVKALQEAMTKIETLETEMTALKARVTALEDA